MSLTFVLLIFLLPFQVSNKRTTKKPYITEQYNKQCVAEPYVAKPYNQVNHINHTKESPSTH